MSKLWSQKLDTSTTRRIQLTCYQPLCKYSHFKICDLCPDHDSREAAFYGQGPAAICLCESLIAGFEFTLEKSVPAATEAVRRVQRSLRPFSSRSRHRAVWAASSLDGANITAPGPFTACGVPFAASQLPAADIELPFGAFELPFAVPEVPSATDLIWSAASAAEFFMCFAPSCAMPVFAF